MQYLHGNRSSRSVVVRIIQQNVQNTGFCTRHSAKKNVITATNNQITQNSRQTLRYPPAGTKALKEKQRTQRTGTLLRKNGTFTLFTPLSKNSRNKQNAKRD